MGLSWQPRGWLVPRLITSATISDWGSHRSRLERERGDRGWWRLIRRRPNPAPVVRDYGQGAGSLRCTHTAIHHRERSDSPGAITSYCFVLCLSFTLTLFGGEIYQLLWITVDQLYYLKHVAEYERVEMVFLQLVRMISRIHKCKLIFEILKIWRCYRYDM